MCGAGPGSCGLYGDAAGYLINCVVQGQGAVDCMETLLEMGAEVDAQDSSGFTALHLAAIG